MRKKNLTMKNKRNMLRLYQVIALLCALSVPVLYMVSIILFSIENQYAQLFLAMAIGVSLFIMPLIYFMTKFPKDMAEIYSNLSDELEDKEDMHNSK